MPEKEAPTEARLLEPREGVGKYWWETYFRNHIPNINRRHRIAGIIHVTPASRMPADLSLHIREAALSFAIGHYMATILFSSSTVELILNRDRRTKNHQELSCSPEGWAVLNERNLTIGQREGLPIQALLSRGESLEEGKHILFVARHNQVSRGEIWDWIRDEMQYNTRAEEEAFDQLRKAELFLINWYNAAPDVRDGRIQDHRWV